MAHFEPAFMPEGHHSRQPSPASEDDVWQLGAGEVLRLRAGPGRRHLRVLDGRLWLTFEVESGEVPEDRWLGPGDGIGLADGERIVVDAHPQARFRLSVPPQACDRGRQAPARRWRLSDWFAGAVGWPA